MACSASGHLSAQFPPPFSLPERLTLQSSTNVLGAFPSSSRTDIDTALDTLYNASGGDVNIPQDDEKRKFLVVHLGLVPISIGLLEHLLSSQFNWPATTALLIRFIRNLCREPNANSLCFNSHILHGSLNNALSVYFRSCEVFSACCGLIWSLATKRNQAQILGPIYISPLSGSLKLHFTSIQVCKYALGALSLLAVDCNTMGSKVDNKLLHSIYEVIKYVDSLVETYWRLIRTISKHTAGGIPYNLKVNLIDSLERYTITRPKLFAFCLQILLDSKMDIEWGKVAGLRKVLWKVLYELELQGDSGAIRANKEIRMFLTTIAQLGLQGICEQRSESNVGVHSIVPLDGQEAIAMSIDPSSRFILIATSDGNAQLVDIPRAHILWTTNHHESIKDCTSVYLSRTLALIGTFQGLLFVLSVSSGSILASIHTSGPIWYCSFALDDSCVVFGSGVDLVSLWIIQTGEIVAICHAHRVSSHGNRFISTHHSFTENNAFQSSHTSIWQLGLGCSTLDSFPSPKIVSLRELDNDRQHIIHAIATCSKYSMTGVLQQHHSGEQECTLYENSMGMTLKVLRSVLAQGSECEACYLSSSGRRALLVSSSTGEICTIDLSTLQVLSRMNHQAAVTCEALSRNGTYVAYQIEGYSYVIVCDIFCDDRKKLLTLLQSKKLSVDIVRIVQTFLF